METTGHIPLSEDAALVAGLAGTAMAFSHSAEDETERWLRALRLHGEVGQVLQGLGVGESPLETTEEQDAPSPPLGSDAVKHALYRAERRATLRRAEAIGTADLLVAVLEAYGHLMDHTLELHGTSRKEVMARLALLDEARERGAAG